jgi:hypothetical protein
VAEATRVTVEKHGLSNKVVVLFWSMAGRILKPMSLGLKERGLIPELFISLAATPAVAGLRWPPSDLEASSAGYSSSDQLFTSFLAQIGEVSQFNGGRTVIDRDIYRKEYLGHTPIGLTGWGFSWSSNMCKLIEDEWIPADSVATDYFRGLPLMATIYPTSMLDIRHTLGDRATWGMMLTYKLLTDVMMVGDRWATEKATTFDEHTIRLQQIRDFLRTAEDRLAIDIRGNHFFFVGEKGAKETATAISDLVVRAREVQAEFKVLTYWKLDD